jgi:hypothetical protein
MLGEEGGRYIVKEFKEINVIGLLSEMFLEKDINCRLKHKRVINRNRPDFLLEINSTV